MRKRFSERNKYQEAREAFQIESIDDGLKNRIWNQVQTHFFDSVELSYGHINLKRDLDFFMRIYDEFYKMHIKVTSRLKDINKHIKDVYFKMGWYEIYDFIEYISEIHSVESRGIAFKTKINKVLEEEMAGYRFVEGYIVQVIDKIEIDEIEQAVNSQYSGAKIHLSNSLESLSDKENPDYIHSIKESISAVESVVNKVSGKSNVALNKCLQHIPFDIDKNFKNALIKLYSWTSSEDGIRHGITNDEIKSTFAEAKYMLVICSAFINYLIEKQKE